MLDIIGQIFWYGIPATPVIAFLIIRRKKITFAEKLIISVAITLGLSFILFIFSMSLLLRDGLGPS